MREEPEWKKITPEHLHAAIEHIRTEFEHGRYGWSIATQVFCCCLLHRRAEASKLLAQNQGELEACLAAVGHSAKEQFDRLMNQGTQPSVFRAYFDLYYNTMRVNLLRGFDQILKIGLANWDALQSHPVRWAHHHSKLMIRGQEPSIEHWIKHACDDQTLPAPDLISSEFEEIIHWTKWRAPKLIYMQPAGNAPYDPKTVWSREDEARTKELLTARSKRFLEFLDLCLEKMAGTAHVIVAQDTRYAERTPMKQRAEPKSGPAVSSDVSAARVPRYRSSLKRGILLQFLHNPAASDLEVCNGLDEDGSVELPDDWKMRADDRLFSKAYGRPMTRRKVEILISKVRVDLRNARLLPPG